MLLQLRFRVRPVCRAVGDHENEQENTKAWHGNLGDADDQWVRCKPRSSSDLCPVTWSQTTEAELEDSEQGIRLTFLPHHSRGQQGDPFRWPSRPCFLVVSDPPTASSSCVFGFSHYSSQPYLSELETNPYYRRRNDAATRGWRQKSTTWR